MLGPHHVLADGYVNVCGAFVAAVDGTHDEGLRFSCVVGPKQEFVQTKSTPPLHTEIASMGRGKSAAANTEEVYGGLRNLTGATFDKIVKEKGSVTNSVKDGTPFL